MKRFSILTIFALFGAGYIFLYPTAMAAPTAKMTLSAGESVKVKRNGCTLQITKNKTTVVRVECQTATSALAGVSAANIASEDVILNAGQKLRIKANGCELAVTKNKPRKVKVKCNALDEPDATVIVGPDGSVTYSGVVNIKVGETVEWVWDSDDHTVTSGEDGTPDGLFCSPDDTDCATAPLSDTGATYRHTFNTSGTFPYYCRVHDGMTSTVNVDEPYIP
jgi:plastocyanin